MASATFWSFWIALLVTLLTNPTGGVVPTVASTSITWTGTVTSRTDDTYRTDTFGSNYTDSFVQVASEGPYDGRFGVIGSEIPGFTGSAILDALNMQSYYEYEWGPAMTGKQRLQMVGRSYQSYAGLDEFIGSHPGSYWLIGNEPNVPNQDNHSPAAYAQIYHDWVGRIKGIDPTAKTVNGGIANWPDVVGHPGAGLAYLREFREAYRVQYGESPPIDVWNIHAYPPFFEEGVRLRSVCDTAEPKRYVAEVVQYLRSVGETQQVWLTEFGMDHALENDPCAVTFMTDMVGWLEQTGLVDRWYWFHLNAQSDGFFGNLVDLQGNLTALGQAYRDLSLQQR